MIFSYIHLYTTSDDNTRKSIHGLPLLSYSSAIKISLSLLNKSERIIYVIIYLCKYDYKVPGGRQEWIINIQSL